MRRLLIIILLISFVLTSCGQFPEMNISTQKLADENGQFVEVDDIELYMQIWGESTNPAIILVHGFGASSFSWRLNGQVLADAGYYVIAVDRPGFGLSDKSTAIDYTHAAQADLLANLMDELNIETVTVAGHSQGGNVVAHFALRHPERLDKLVIVAGAIVPSGESGVDFGSIASLALEPSPLLQKLADNWFASKIINFVLGSYFTESRVTDLMASAYGDPDLMTNEMIEGYYRPFRTRGWEAGLIAMTLDSDGNILANDELTQIETPTLILWGTADTWVPIEGGNILAEILPNAQMITYPDIGHSPMDTVADAFHTDLLAFLAEE